MKRLHAAWEGYGRARDYYQAQGHLKVPSGHVTADRVNLGQWIVNARQHHRKGWMRPDRVAPGVGRRAGMLSHPAGRRPARWGRPVRALPARP